MMNSYLGLRGSFGTILIGRYDNTITYFTPGLYDFQFLASFIPASSSDYYPPGMTESSEIKGAYSLAIRYDQPPIYASSSFEVIIKDDKTREEANFQKLRIGFGILDLGGFYLSAIHEAQKSLDFRREIEGGEMTINPDGHYDATPPIFNNSDLWQVQTGYAFGNNLVKGMYGVNKYHGGRKIKSYSFGLDHTLSKRTKSYILYTHVHDQITRYDKNNWKGFSLGLIHSF